MAMYHNPEAQVYLALEFIPNAVVHCTIQSKKIPVIFALKTADILPVF